MDTGSRISKKISAEGIIALVLKVAGECQSNCKRRYKVVKKSLYNIGIFVTMAIMSAWGAVSAQDKSFTITVDKSINGTLIIDPAPPADGKYTAGTVITLSAVPDSGYTIDSVYFSVNGRFGQMYHESMTSPFRVTVDQEKHIGASFIKKAAVAHVNVIQDVVYARPGVKPLKYDVYTPGGAKKLPIIIIIHGGGWTANNEDIMRGMARELTGDGKYVVCSIDYRWAQKQDGDATGNSMADLIGDVYGAIAHIMEHAPEYGGDPTEIALTGDSAGGHLSAAAANMPDKIGKGGFGKTPGVFEFEPSYIPGNKTIEQLRSEMMAAIRAAAPSYGVFGGSLLNHYSDDPAADDSWKNAIAPLYNIPLARERAVPQYLLRGTNDFLITDEAVKAYVDVLVKAGQRVEYVQAGGATHAFFDWKPDEKTRATFALYGVFYCHEMEGFFNSVFYPVLD
jgi:acetyl esterase